MMSSKPAKRFTPRFKFQIVLESLKGEKSVGQLARAYGTHPISIHRWKKEFMEKGPEIFSQDTTIHEYEKKIAERRRNYGNPAGSSTIKLWNGFIANGIYRLCAE
jgi:transposase-like protein